jgi:hypothetical protein
MGTGVKEASEKRDALKVNQFSKKEIKYVYLKYHNYKTHYRIDLGLCSFLDPMFLWLILIGRVMVMVLFPLGSITQCGP